MTVDSTRADDDDAPPARELEHNSRSQELPLDEPI